MMRLITVISLVGVLGFSLLSEDVFAQTLQAIRSITVSGQAERKVVPDEAHIGVNLNAQDKQMSIAKTAHDAKLKKLIEIVKNAGIDEKKIRTESSSIQPIYNYRNVNAVNTRVFEGYRVQTNLDVTVLDTSKLGDLMQAITDAGFEKGANTEWGNLMNMYYTVSNPDKLRDEMLVEAIANAKAKAERMASAAGATLGAVYQINEGGVSNYIPQPMMMRAMAAGDAEEMAAPPAGEQKVQSSVTVTYELK